MRSEIILSHSGFDNRLLDLIVEGQLTDRHKNGPGNYFNSIFKNYFDFLDHLKRSYRHSRDMNKVISISKSETIRLCEI